MRTHAAEQRPQLRFVARGSRVRHAKLTEKKVIEMRRLYAEALRTGDKAVTMKSLGERFHVHKMQVWKILHRIQWRHV